MIALLWGLVFNKGHTFLKAVQVVPDFLDGFFLVHVKIFPGFRMA